VIKPTVGRIVWFYPASNEDKMPYDKGQPLAAIVTKVWSDTMVNLAVFDANGIRHGRTSVPLRQPGPTHPDNYYCEWMPYQIGQAAKHAEMDKPVLTAP
jgi:hypothetical protein